MAELTSSAPTKLFKYRSGASQDLDSLRRYYIWAAGLGTLNDPFESRVQLEELPFGWIFESELQFLRRCGICSFGRTPLDSRCWAYYAANYQGYCVEYDTEALTNSIPAESLLLNVRYSPKPPYVEILESTRLLISNPTERRLNYAQVIIGTKGMGWEHEQESRIVTLLPGRISHDPRATVAVYLGRNASKKLRAAIMRLPERVRILEVRPSGRDYDLETIVLR